MLALISLFASSQPLFAVVKGVFQAPAIDTFILHGESGDDEVGDGINEAHIRRYLNKAGAVFSVWPAGKSYGHGA